MYTTACNIVEGMIVYKVLKAAVKRSLRSVAVKPASYADRKLVHEYNIICVFVRLFSLGHFNANGLSFFTARRYASAVCCHRVSVCSSVRHKLVFYKDG